MVHVKPVLRGSLFVVLFCCGLSLFAQQPSLTVDHRYSPPWWQTLVCMPDDPVKTLIGREGQLFGDYDYKGPRDFSFSLGLDGRSPLSWQSQRLLLARAPILRTVKTDGAITVTEEAFLQIPEPEGLNSIVRYDSRRVERDWSKPRVACDAAFNNIAMGLKGLSGEGLVEFHIRVRPGAGYAIALGFCEGHYDTAGTRKMRIQVEGAEQKDIDPVKDFGAHMPGVYLLNGRDADGDGILTVVVSNMPGTLDRNAFVNGLWMFEGNAPVAADIVSGKEDKAAVLYAPCADVRMPARRYHVLVKVRNGGARVAEFKPVLRYRGVEVVKSAAGGLAVGNETMVNVSTGAGVLQQDSAETSHLDLPVMKLAAGEEREFSVTVSRFFADGGYQPTVALTKQEESKALSWWKKNCPSAAAVSVPDTGIQAMIESSIRNIFQARDIRKGSPSFHVGPTIYRGLWLADGTYLLEVGTMLGYKKDVRSCIDYLTHYQLPGGGFEMITTFHKENGLVPIMLVRHAMLTQDKAWMEKNWSVVEGCLRRIRYLRDVAAKDTSKSYYGLLPDGNVDGGIQHGNDYSNTEYCLSGMKWAISAAHWLGKEEQAAAWQKEYNDFFHTFLTMARKDLRKDDDGNTYLPVMIRNEDNYAPQKGQWAFCQSVYPGQIFDTTEETRRIATGTVDMLHDHRVEGLVINTGWMEQGLWTYFSSFYGHDLLWLGKPKEVPQLLYDYANHSSPTMDWREEQKPQGKGNEEVGDMPHNWASAEFIRLVVHMLELDRGNDLHLFEALPPNWLAPGKRVELHGIQTPYGPIEMSLVVNARGDAAQLKLQFAETANLPRKVVVHKDNWTAGGGVTEVAGTSAIDMNIPLK